MPLLNDQYVQTLEMAKPLDELYYRTLSVDIKVVKVGWWEGLE